MIGTQPTGHVPSVVISAVTHEGLTVVAAGRDVAREFLKGNGHLRVLSAPINTTEH